MTELQRTRDLHRGPFAALQQIATHPEKFFGFGRIDVHVADANDAKDTQHSLESIVTFAPLDYRKYPRAKGAPNPLLGKPELTRLLEESAGLLCATHPDATFAQAHANAKSLLTEHAKSSAHHDHLFPKGITATQTHAGIETHVELVPWKGQALLMVRWPREMGFDSNALKKIISSAGRNGVMNPKTNFAVWLGKHMHPDFEATIRPDSFFVPREQRGRARR